MDQSRHLAYLAAAAAIQYLLIRRGPDWAGAIWPVIGLVVVAVLLATGHPLNNPDVLAFGALTVITFAMWRVLRGRSFPYGRR